MRRLGWTATDGSGLAVRDPSLVDARRVCAWCRGPMRAEARRDAKTCGQPCRQALHRFRVVPAGPTDAPARFAYADPPYPGLARRYYGCDEVDHCELVAKLVQDFPDGWALSTSAAALQAVLALCPSGVRVCVWVKGARATTAVRARNAFEPLIVAGGRLRHVAVSSSTRRGELATTDASRSTPTTPVASAGGRPVAPDLRDVLQWGGRQHSHPGALVGMKPAAFCEWMFRLLGAAAGDELVDLFPGSGAVSRAWGLYTSQLEVRRL